jgi:copper chaperone CopZ
MAILVLLLAQDVPTQKHRVTGLWSADRIDDLKETVKKLPDVAVVSVDLEAGEAVFSYDPAKLFPKIAPKDHVDRLDNLLRQASQSTFGVKPLIPPEKRTRVEISVSGLDCKGCGLAVYEIVGRTDGVAQALVDLKGGRLVAFIDPEKTNKAALEEALKKRQVKVNSP